MLVLIYSYANRGDTVGSQWGKIQFNPDGYAQHNIPDADLPRLTPIFEKVIPYKEPEADRPVAGFKHVVTPSQILQATTPFVPEIKVKRAEPLPVTARMAVYETVVLPENPKPIFKRDPSAPNTTVFAPNDQEGSAVQSTPANEGDYDFLADVALPSDTASEVVSPELASTLSNLVQTGSLNTGDLPVLTKALEDEPVQPVSKSRPVPAAKSPAKKSATVKKVSNKRG